MLDRGQFVEDLRKFVGFKTVVCENPTEFDAANRWIRAFFDPTRTDFVDFDCHGLTSTLIKPKDSDRPRVLGDGHIEVVPGADPLFTLGERDGRLWGRGVADMKTQCLVMIYVLRDLIAEGRHNDFWLLLSEDEEVGSAAGVAVVADYLEREGLFPEVVFAPDGGPDFAYVEKEKGIMSFSARIEGEAAHADDEWLDPGSLEPYYRLAYETARL